MVIVKFPTAEKKTVVQAPTVTGWDSYVVQLGKNTDEYKASEFTFYLHSKKNDSDPGTYSSVGPTITYADDTSKDQIDVANPTLSDIGTSTMVLSLKDKKHMIWSDTKDNKDKQYPYKLSRFSFLKPSLRSVSDTMTYDGNNHNSVLNDALSICDAEHPISIYDAMSTDNMLLYDVDDERPLMGFNGILGSVCIYKDENVDLNNYIDSASDTYYEDYELTNPGTYSLVSDLYPTYNWSEWSDNRRQGPVELTYTIQPLKFSEATDAEIVQIVAKANAGEVDLENDFEWAVGQEHTLTLPAIPKSGSYDGQDWSVGEDQPEQQVTLVLMDTGENSGYKFTSGSTVNFVVGLKNTLAETGYMNSSNTNGGSWDGSARRKWCNGGFRQAMESVLPGVFKQFNVVTAETYNGSSNKTSQDYFSLFAAKEIYGGTASSADEVKTSWSNLAEFNALKQIKWYQTIENISKTTADGVAGYWFERSPTFNSLYYFCEVGDTGYRSRHLASDPDGLAPFGCI